METLLWPAGCSSMLNCSFIADRQLSKINQRIKWLHNEWEHFSSGLNKTSEITSVDKNKHRLFYLPPPYLGVQAIGVHGILFPFSHNLVSAPPLPWHWVPWLQTQQKPEASGWWLRLAPSLINLTLSHCLLSEYTNSLFVQRFRSVLVGNFIFLSCAAVSPPRQPQQPDL